MNSLLSSYIRILFIFIFIFINTPVPWSLPTHLIYMRYLWVTFFEVGDPNRTTQEKPYPILLTHSGVDTRNSVHTKKLSHPWWCRIFSTYQSHNFHEAKPTLDFQASYVLYFWAPTLLVSTTSLPSLEKAYKLSRLLLSQKFRAFRFTLCNPPLELIYS